MKLFLLVATLIAALAGCATPREDGPAWERNDPARRVYGGGL